MYTLIHITNESSQEIFCMLRELALENVHHVLPIYRLDIPKERACALAREWVESGWSDLAHIQGPAMLGNYRLAEDSLAYGPGEVREMIPEEREHYLVAAIMSLSDKESSGTVLVNKFVALTRKEGLYRLIDAGIVSHASIGIGSRHTHVLAKEYWG